MHQTDELTLAIIGG